MFFIYFHTNFSGYFHYNFSDSHKTETSMAINCSINFVALRLIQKNRPNKAAYFLRLVTISNFKILDKVLHLLQKFFRLQENE